MKQKYETSDSPLSFLKDELFVPSSSSSSSPSQLTQSLVKANNSPSVRYTTSSPPCQEEEVQHHDDRPFVGSYNRYANQSSVPKQKMSQHMLFDKPGTAEVSMHNTIENVSDHYSDSGSDFDAQSQDGEEQSDKGSDLDAQSQDGEEQFAFSFEL